MSSPQPPKSAARRNEFRTVKDGWLDGVGLASEPAGLDWLAEAI